MPQPQVEPRRGWIPLAIVGLAVGVASGLFGVGGGIIIVPALVYLLRFDHKIASGTSLLAIVAPSLVGVAGYALNGQVDVLLAALLAVGSIVGAPIGAFLLKRLERYVIQSAFIVFLVIIIVSLLVVVPSRESHVHLDLLTGSGVTLLGVFAGICGGMLGIGGGAVVVPVLVLLFGASDLVAKGSSLLMIIATGLSGTIANIRHKQVDLMAAAVIGAGAAVTTPLGVWLAHALSPQAASIVFAAFLVLVIVRMLLDILVVTRKRRDDSA